MKLGNNIINKAEIHILNQIHTKVFFNVMYQVNDQIRFQVDNEIPNKLITWNSVRRY